MLEELKAIKWRIAHLKNMLWSAKNPDGLFNKSHIFKFEKELKTLKDDVRRLR